MAEIVSSPLGGASTSTRRQTNSRFQSRFIVLLLLLLLFFFFISIGFVSGRRRRSSSSRLCGGAAVDRTAGHVGFRQLTSDHRPDVLVRQSSPSTSIGRHRRSEGVHKGENGLTQTTIHILLPQGSLCESKENIQHRSVGGAYIRAISRTVVIGTDEGPQHVLFFSSFCG